MSSVVISGDTSGAITLAAPAVAGTNTITLPASTGTAVIGSAAVSAVGQIPFSTDGTSYTPTAKVASGTAIASTSGTSIDFTSIPSWVKRVTVMFSGVSTSGTSIIQIQIGSGSFTTSGYTGSGFIALNASSPAVANNSTGFLTSGAGDGAYVRQGSVVLSNVTGNTWSANGVIGQSDSARINMCGGALALSGTLDRVRITTVNGTDTFDAGIINILYE